MEQDDFVSGVLEVETMLEPYELLEFLHEVESKAKRERLQHWGPRTLDLDIIFYDDEIIAEYEEDIDVGLIKQVSKGGV